MAQVLGIVLAGGRGNRLRAGVPKALAKIAGTTLLERAVETLRPIADSIAITAPAAMDLAVARALAGPVRIVADVPGARGPLSGLVAGLTSESFVHAIVLAVDFPLARREFLWELKQRIGSRDAVLPAPDGIPQPLLAVYQSGAGARLRRSLDSGERGATRAALALDTRLLDDAELEALPGGLDNTWNVNTPEDLAEAERRLARATGVP